jgi:hypothetical protein
MKHLRALVSTRGLADNWSLILPLAQRILNTTSDSSIGRPPMEIIFGNMLPNLDNFIFQYVDGVPLDIDTVEPYLAQLIENQAKLIKTSREFLHTAEFKQPSVEQDPSKIVKFEVGDLVLAKWPGNGKPPNKLSSKYMGPLSINKLIRDDMVETKHLSSGKLETFHVTRLIPFYKSENVSEEELIHWAGSDKLEEVVDRIIDHIGSPKKKTDMDFKVVFWGEDESQALWLPYLSVRDLEALDVYIKDKPSLSALKTT